LLKQQEADQRAYDPFKVIKSPKVWLSNSGSISLSFLLLVFRLKLQNLDTVVLFLQIPG